jgi:polyhydroxyalkanoate synthesis regulator phasin
MAWTTAETTRIQAIETVLNSLQLSIANLMSKAQYRQLLLLKQADITDLQNRVIALESQIQTLQNKIK